MEYYFIQGTHLYNLGGEWKMQIYVLPNDVRHVVGIRITNHHVIQSPTTYPLDHE